MEAGSGFEGKRWQGNLESDGENGGRRDRGRGRLGGVIELDSKSWRMNPSISAALCLSFPKCNGHALEFGSCQG